MCRIDYADPSDFAAPERRRKARQQHRCVECLATINPGDYYQCQTLFTDGRSETYRTCEACVPARQWLMDQCNGWIFGEVLEELVEHWEEDTAYRTPELGRLIVQMRLRLRRNTVSAGP